MRLARYSTPADPTPRVGLIEGDAIRPIGPAGALLSDLLHAGDPAAQGAEWAKVIGGSIPLASARLLAPIDRQEVWGAGVTYERSKVARQEESEQAASFYDLVYRADRPELFFKATPSRVVGPGEAIRVRQDTRWCVPEPELALMISPDAPKIVGYTVGDDVSARDIEGENPLYLPQAKVYDACCGLGPAVTLAGSMPPLAEVVIRLEIDRGSARPSSDESTSALADGPEARRPGRLARAGQPLPRRRGPPDRHGDRPAGRLHASSPGDLVRITIDGIGTLVNPVVPRADRLIRPARLTLPRGRPHLASPRGACSGGVSGALGPSFLESSEGRFRRAGWRPDPTMSPRGLVGNDGIGRRRDRAPRGQTGPSRDSGLARLRRARPGCHRGGWMLLVRPAPRGASGGPRRRGRSPIKSIASASGTVHRSTPGKADRESRWAAHPQVVRHGRDYRGPSRQGRDKERRRRAPLSADRRSFLRQASFCKKRPGSILPSTCSAQCRAELLTIDWASLSRSSQRVNARSDFGKLEVAATQISRLRIARGHEACFLVCGDTRDPATDSPISHSPFPVTSHQSGSGRISRRPTRRRQDGMDAVATEGVMKTPPKVTNRRFAMVVVKNLALGVLMTGMIAAPSPRRGHEARVTTRRPTPNGESPSPTTLTARPRPGRRDTWPPSAATARSGMGSSGYGPAYGYRRRSRPPATRSARPARSGARPRPPPAPPTSPPPRPSAHLHARPGLHRPDLHAPRLHRTRRRPGPGPGTGAVPEQQLRTGVGPEPRAASSGGGQIDGGPHGRRVPELRVLGLSPRRRSLTSGNPQSWYQQPGRPGRLQRHAHRGPAVGLHRRGRCRPSTHAYATPAGLNISLTTDPTQNYAHTLSVVSGASYNANPNAIGITDVGNDGFSFIDKFGQAQELPTSWPSPSATTSPTS